jgi:hypothetical protein
MNARRDQIRGPRFVVQTALERAVGADERFERLADIGIDGARGGERGLDEPGAQIDQEWFMFAQELLGDLDVLVGDLIRVQGARFFVEARFDEVGTIERATDGDFAFVAAAERADFAADAGAVAARFARLADLAFHGGRGRCFYRSIGLEFRRGWMGWGRG